MPEGILIALILGVLWVLGLHNHRRGRHATTKRHVRRMR